MATNMKLLIAVPTFDDNVCTETYKSIWNATRNTEHMDTKLEFVKGYSADEARNKIGRMVVDGGYSHVLMIDSDIVIPPNTVFDILDTDKAVVLGYYNRKDGKGSVMFREGPGNFDEPKIIKSPDELTERYTKIKGGGLGCALISSGVFETLDPPWFKYITYPNGNVLSEDLFFCEHVTANSISVWLDKKIICKHKKTTFV